MASQMQQRHGNRQREQAGASKGTAARAEKLASCYIAYHHPQSLGQLMERCRGGRTVIWACVRNTALYMRVSLRSIRECDDITELPVGSVSALLGPILSRRP